MTARTRLPVVFALAITLAPAVIANAQTVNVCAMMRAKPGKADELREALLALAGPTRADEGHIAYDVYEEKNGGLFLHEAWRSQQDLDNHLKKPAVQDFAEKSPGRLDGKNDAHFGRALSISEKPEVIQDNAGAESISICSVKHPKAGRADELRRALLSLTGPTGKEPGNLAYNIYEEEDGSLFLFETWRSMDDLQRHFGKPYVKDFRSKVNDLADINEVHIGKLISN